MAQLPSGKLVSPSCATIPSPRGNTTQPHLYLAVPPLSCCQVSKYGGRVVLAVGVLCWSMATVAAPICAYTGIWALCFVRFLVVRPCPPRPFHGDCAPLCVPRHSTR